MTNISAIDFAKDNSSMILVAICCLAILILTLVIFNTSDYTIMGELFSALLFFVVTAISILSYKYWACGWDCDECEEQKHKCVCRVTDPEGNISECICESISDENANEIKAQ